MCFRRQDGERDFGTARASAVARAAVTDAPDGTRWVGLWAVRTRAAERAPGPAGRLCEALLAWGARSRRDPRLPAGWRERQRSDRLRRVPGFPAASSQPLLAGPVRHLGYRLAMPDGTLRLATWNVNSIRTRLDRVVDWPPTPMSTCWPCRRRSARIASFPRCRCSNSATRSRTSASISGTGWRSPRASAWKMCRSASTASPPGVASQKWPPRRKPALWAPPAAACGCGACYVPNGRTLDDPHYTYKLDWLAALRDTAEGWLRDDPAAQIALVGDWNIPPTDDDV